MELSVTPNLGSLQDVEVALKAFLGRNDEDVHEGIKKLQHQIEEFKKPQVDDVRPLVLEPTAPVEPSHNDNHHEIGNNSGFNPSASKATTKVSSSLSRKHNVDEEVDTSTSKRQRIKPPTSRQKPCPIRIAQRDPRPSQYILLSSRPVIVLARAKSFYGVRDVALEEVLRARKGTLDMESLKALFKSVKFWARVLGNDGQQKYLDFLKLAKSVKQWAEPKESQCVLEDMKNRKDPKMLQDVVENYMLQDSMKTHVGMGKFDYMMHLAAFHQVYRALAADVDLPSGEVHFIEPTLENVEHFYEHDLELVTFSPENVEHFFKHIEFKRMIKVSSSFFALKAKFGSGIFVFLLERPVKKMFRKATRKILSYVIDALAQFIPDILIICQQVTSRLIEPLMRGEVPRDLKSSLSFERRSLLQLVTATTQDLTFYTVDQIENERADEEQTSNSTNQ